MSENLGQTKIHLPMNQVLPGSQLPAFFSSSAGGGSASSASSSACGPRLVGPWKRASIIQEAPRVEQRQPPKKTCTFKTTETQNSFLSKVHVSCSGKTSSYGTHFLELKTNPFLMAQPLLPLLPPLPLPLPSKTGDGLGMSQT